MSFKIFKIMGDPRPKNVKRRRNIGAKLVLGLVAKYCLVSPEIVRAQDTYVRRPDLDGYRSFS